MSKIILLCIICLYATNICEAYKALVVFPFPGKSHSILGDGIVRRLLEDGHEVTYITTFPKVLKQHPFLREIDISSLRELVPDDMLNIEKIMKSEIHVQGLLPFMKMLFEIQIGCLNHEEVNNLLNDPKEQFDVVIVEWMLLELISGISAVYNCPYIWVSSVDPHWMVLKLIDEIPNPAYNADPQSTSTIPFTFLQRTVELLNIICGLGLQYFYIANKEHRVYDNLLAPIIRKRGHIVPDFEQVRFNASLMLGNSHVSMGEPTRLPQSYKPIGGYHIDDNINPLSQDLKKLLDDAKHGVIYFSMGSNLRSKYMPAELKVSLLKMFGNLKQTILWKFEEDLQNRPSNVHIIQWAPQQSILVRKKWLVTTEEKFDNKIKDGNVKCYYVLAHQNCILFITHGGLLSTTEAIHLGKPIIGIPVFADQFNNVDRCVNRGFAKRVDLSNTMANELEKAIKEIIADPSYSDKAKQLSFIYHDRPVSPGKELAHWVQHVVRTGGAPHLRSPALLVPWYQKCYLDLVLLIVVILYTFILLINKSIRCFSQKQKKEKAQ